jgi:hypothetical protein
LMRNGIAYRLPPLVPLTAGIESGSWPTPAASLHNLTEDLDGWRERRERVKATVPNGGRAPKVRMEAARTWPTPTSRDWKDGSAKACANMPSNALLGRVVHQWPTPRANTAMAATITAEAMENPNRFPNLETVVARSDPAAAVGGSLNPTWVEWLMGFPLGWTVLNALEIASSRKSPK